MNERNKIAVDTYNKIAKKYDEEFGNDYSDAPYIDSFLNILSGKEILDIGCGVRSLTNYMCEKDFNVTGIDLFDGMLRIAKEKYKNINFIKMDMKNITLNKKYDGISILYSLFHLTKNEVKEVLSQYYDLLKENGKMLLILQSGNGEKVVEEPLDKNLKMFVNYYSLDEIKEVLENNKFKVLYTTYKKGCEGSLSDIKLVILCEKEKNYEK